jgi:hypothetical protein
MKLKDKLKARLTAIVGELNALNETISAEGYVANADDKTAGTS